LTGLYFIIIPCSILVSIPFSLLYLPFEILLSFHVPFLLHPCSILMKNPSNTWLAFILPTNSRTLTFLENKGIWVPPVSSLYISSLLFLLYHPCIFHPSYSSCIFLVYFIPPIPPVSSLYISSILFLLYLPCIFQPSYSSCIFLVYFIPPIPSSLANFRQK